VGQCELEGDQHGGGERRELDRALPSRDERHDERQRDGEDGDDGLEEAEVGNPRCVVLAPAPDRKR
jgi:hypothetical protein